MDTNVRPESMQRITTKELADASEFRITDKSENHRFGEGILQVFGPEKLAGKTYRENKEIKYLQRKETKNYGTVSV